MKPPYEKLIHYVKLKLCVLAHSSRKVIITHRPKLRMLMTWKQDKISETSKLTESILGSRPSKDYFCSPETKHIRRMVPKTKLYVSASRLQEQRLEALKSALPYRRNGVQSWRTFQTNYCIWCCKDKYSWIYGQYLFSCYSTICRRLSGLQYALGQEKLTRNVSICWISPQQHCRQSASAVYKILSYDALCSSPAFGLVSRRQ